MESMPVKGAVCFNPRPSSLRGATPSDTMSQKFDAFQSSPLIAEGRYIDLWFCAIAERVSILAPHR